MWDANDIVDFDCLVAHFFLALRFPFDRPRFLLDRPDPVNAALCRSVARTSCSQRPNFRDRV
jgi:hypothetical protein